LGTFAFKIDDNLFAELEKACKTMGITTEEGLKKAIRHILNTDNDDQVKTPAEQRLLAMIMAEAREAKREDKARIKAERKGLIRAVK
jgi:metal-responsive CopG/Arc/MetJ family transcriptional regulator